MLFIVQFEDEPSHAHVRIEQMAAHLEFLDQMSDRVLVAGSLRDPVSNIASGGLWIVEAENADAVRQIFATDPFWIHRLRADVRIRLWSKAFPERRVLV